MKQIVLAIIACAALVMPGNVIANPGLNDRSFTGTRDYLTSSSVSVFGAQAPQITVEARFLLVNTDALNELGVDLNIDGVTLFTEKPDGSTGVYRTDANAATGMTYMNSLLGQTLDGLAGPTKPVGAGFLFGDQLLIDVRPGSAIPYDATAIDSNATLDDRFLSGIGSISESGFGLPLFTGRDLPVQVVMSDGTSVLIGFETGLREYREPVDIPLLGQVPLLKRLFVGNVAETERRELIVHIKPTIVPESESE
jgi:Flp pilus assembly secretin CpaC